MSDPHRAVARPAMVQPTQAKWLWRAADHTLSRQRERAIKGHLLWFVPARQSAHAGLALVSRFGTQACLPAEASA